MIFVIPDGIGDADTDIPHLRFLGTSHPAAECPPFLRMLDLRHIRLLTAQVEGQLQHGGKGLPVFLPTANVTIVPLSHEQIVHLIHTVHSVQQRSFAKGQRDHFRLIAALQEHGKLEIHVSAEEVVIQVRDEALHRMTFVGQPRRFNVHRPFREMVQAVRRQVAREGLTDQRLIDFRGKPVYPFAGPP